MPIDFVRAGNTIRLRPWNPACERERKPSHLAAFSFRKLTLSDARRPAVERAECADRLHARRIGDGVVCLARAVARLRPRHDAVADDRADAPGLGGGVRHAHPVGEVAGNEEAAKARAAPTDKRGRDVIRRAAILVLVPLTLAALVAVPLGLWRGPYQWLCAGIALGLTITPGVITLVIAERLAKAPSPHVRVLA